MSDVIIKAENLSKRFLISHQVQERYTSLRDVLTNRVKDVLSFGSNGDNKSLEREDFWALKDLNFEIKRGDRVGIIGRNGAGKSTLLKILSRITEPTKGKVTIEGRVASLLEVGTGFHPELSGRENIFLNGAILGMKRAEIREKFDEIVAFAEVEKFLDTPVKRYSSGMYVRLAFAVAAHLEPEILIVDEVLAVGDVQFQRKCLGKMEDVSRTDGRTVLFVSHNMSAIQKLCTSGMYLNCGLIKGFGKIDSVVNLYLESGQSRTNSGYSVPLPFSGDGLECYVNQVRIENIDGEPVNEILVGMPWQIRVYFKSDRSVKHFIVALGITNNSDFNIRTAWSNPVDLDCGNYEAIFKESELMLSVGSYRVAVGLSSYEKAIQYIENIATLYISDVQVENLDKSIIRTSGSGLVLNPMDTSIVKTKD